MKLADLNPKLTGGILVFDCPVCRSDDAHKIRVPLEPTVDRHGQSWKWSGEFPNNLTLSQSVNAGCAHGHIVNGEWKSA